MNVNEEKNIEYLYEVIKNIDNVEDCRILFTDLCTPKEIEAMAQRMTAAKLLMSGKTYEQVIAVTNISSATLSRVSRCVQYGTGYRKFIRP
jgi:TrpR-related protein YerC/YecD